MGLKSFDDLRREVREENPSLFFALEMVSKLMATRNRKRLSQRELSRLSGVSQKTISRLESGLDSPTLETLVKLASALNMEIVIVENTKKER